MNKPRTAPAKDKVVRAAVELFRTQGYTATTVDQICENAGVTKGAFFHHFESKEAIAEECLARWERKLAEVDGAAPFHETSDPVVKLFRCMDFYIQIFDTPNLVTSCLIGTTVQEISDTHPRLREAANLCFLNSGQRFQTQLDTAAQAAGKTLDTASLTSLWMAAIQGSLILYKASQDRGVIRRNLEHVRDYFRALLGVPSSGAGPSEDT